MNCTFEDKRKTFLDYRYRKTHLFAFANQLKVKGF